MWEQLTHNETPVTTRSRKKGGSGGKKATTPPLENDTNRNLRWGHRRDTEIVAAVTACGFDVSFAGIPIHEYTSTYQ